MNVWLITVGEPLPTDPGAPRLLRTGILANLLAEHGHQVVWWTSTFDHWKKVDRHGRDHVLSIRKNLQIRLLHSLPYRTNVSVTRLLNHFHMAYKFSRFAGALPRPDVVLCSLPTIALSVAATRLGKEWGVPVLLDVRDLWPDIFKQAIPQSLRWLGKYAIEPLERLARRGLRDCTGIVAVSEQYLKWGLEKAGRSKGKYDRVFPLAYQRQAVDGADRRHAERKLRQRGVSPEKILVWYIGTFGKTYDLGTVIEAARSLSRRGESRVQFVFSGSGEMEQEWKAKADGVDSVVFTGWIDTPEIDYLMSVAGIGLAAYRANAPQGLPNKLIEYLAGEMAVLSSLKGEGERLLRDGDCGLVYEAGDAASCERAITRLLDDDEETRAMGRRGAALYRAKFQASAVYGEMVQFLGSVAHQTRTA